MLKPEDIDFAMDPSVLKDKPSLWSAPFSVTLVVFYALAAVAQFTYIATLASDRL